MTGIESTIKELVATKERMKEHKSVLLNLRKHEKCLVKDIQSYLNEKGDTGIRLDPNTYITIQNKEKKLPMTKKEYRSYVEQILYDRGIDSEELVNRILDKTSNIVQEQSLKINKTK